MKQLLILLLAVSAFASSATSGYSLQARYGIAGSATWDYVTVDDTTHRLYVAHGGQVDILDTHSGAAIGRVSGSPGVHGIAVANNLNRGFTSNGGDNTATIFDLKTFATIGKVKVGSRPDRIYYDVPSQRVFTCNHGSGDITQLLRKPAPSSASFASVVAVSNSSRHLAISSTLRIPTHRRC